VADKRLLASYIKALSKFLDLESVIIDEGCIHTHQHATGAKEGSKSKLWDVVAEGFTSKLHISIDVLGNLLEIILTGGLFICLR